MATLKSFPSRNSYRLSYGVAFGGTKKWKQRYAKTKREGELRMLQARQLEEASRIQMASEEQIHGWVRERLLTHDEAIQAFPAYADLIQQRRQQGLESTDYDHIFDVYDEISITRSKGGFTGRTHTSNKSRANQIKEWLILNVPSLDQMNADTVREYLDHVERRNSKKTAWHHLNVMRAVIDQAVKLRMCRENVARSVQYRQPKPQRSRRILTRSEIDQILKGAKLHPNLLGGSLPIVVGMGLYTGMRDEEMIWSRWDRLNPETRVYEIGHTTCEVTGKVWYPKGTRARRVPFPPKLMELLKQEKERQTEACSLGDFILSGRKPYHVDRPQQAFRKMIANLDLSDDITIYSMRHTFATFLLRSPADGGAGKDIRTVQELMGHEDIKTTMIYLDFIKPEEHPSDALPY